MDKKVSKNDAILKAAGQEFLNQGLKGAVMENIARLAEVSKRTLYKYYPCKEDLFNALIDEVLENIEGSYKFEYDKNKGLEVQLREVAKAKSDLVTSKKFMEVSRIILGELLKSRKPSEEQLQKMMESEARFVNWVKEAQAAGHVLADKDPEIMATQFHSILKGEIYYPVLFGLCKTSKEDIQKSQERAVEFFMNSFASNWP